MDVPAGVTQEEGNTEFVFFLCSFFRSGKREYIKFNN